MTHRDELCVIPALKAHAGPRGSFVLTSKFIDGMTEYAKRWPGPVRALVGQADRPDVNLDPIVVRSGEIPFELDWLPDRRDMLAAELASARLVLASLIDEHADLAEVCVRAGAPLVFVSEYSVATRRQIVRAETRNPLLRWRRELWNVQLERRFERAVRMAAGIQCSGMPAYQAYRHLNRNPMLYFDTRTRFEQVATAATIAPRLAELLDRRPLRLAFSGRLAGMKGVDHLPLVAAELRRLGVEFTMDICGGGPLEIGLRRRIRRLDLGEVVRLRGVLDFQRELMPWISRNVDLFVCCHRQGDPSCTYLETMSCGVPIIGYDNEAMVGVASASGTGWLTPMDKPALMAKRIAELDGRRPALAAAAAASCAFAAEHTFEQTMQARIDHMLACAEAQAGVKPVRAQEAVAL